MGIRVNGEFAGKPVIAVVDDDRGLLKALGRLLSLAGFQTMMFDSVEACLEGLSEASFDCVITDLSMGGLDGFGLKARLEQLTPETPVILLTGCGDPGIGARAKDAGFVACLAKPCEAARLLPIINEAVQSVAVGRYSGGRGVREARLVA